jgi:hypothetical protein
MSALEHHYRYPAPSVRAGDKLVWQTSRGAEADAEPFLVGRLTQPRATADWLLTVAALVRQRFFTPPAMRERLILLADPVVTVGRSEVCFEGFSSCGGVHARLDVGEAAVDAARRSFGTTNVDFGPAMREALTAIRDREQVRLQVGADAIELAGADRQVVERRVPLPLRWLRGFAEVPAVMARMAPCAELRGDEMLALVRALPRTRASGWLVPNGRTLRLSPTASRDGLRIGGAERLALLESVLRHAERVQIHGCPGAAEAPFGVVLQRPGLQLTVVLSAAPWRGFSGEGALLRELVRPVPDEVAARVRASLSWQDACPPPVDALESAAFAQLAITGAAGYSLSTRRYFRRELPFVRAPLVELQPRLVAARELVAAGAVRWQHDLADVDSGEATYRVARDAVGEWTCTCPWFAKARGQQGPCKHALAAEMTAETAHE